MIDVRFNRDEGIRIRISGLAVRRERKMHDFAEGKQHEKPRKGHDKRGCSEMCVVTNQAVTEPDPAGRDAAPPAVSAVLAYTSTLHHEKGF